MRCLNFLIALSLLATPALADRPSGPTGYKIKYLKECADLSALTALVKFDEQIDRHLIRVDRAKGELTGFSKRCEEYKANPSQSGIRFDIVIAARNSALAAAKQAKLSRDGLEKPRQEIQTKISELGAVKCSNQIGNFFAIDLKNKQDEIDQLAAHLCQP